MYNLNATQSSESINEKFCKRKISFLKDRKEYNWYFQSSLENFLRGDRSILS